MQTEIEFEHTGTGAAVEKEFEEAGEWETVWANISWGSYWAWDPKETWALITLLIYAFALHQGSISLLRKPKFFHAYSIFAFLAVLVTYFGVNLFLGGMHAYN